MQRYTKENSPLLWKKKMRPSLGPNRYGESKMILLGCGSKLTFHCFKALKSLKTELEDARSELEETKVKSKAKIRDLQNEVKEMEEGIAETRGLRNAAEEVSVTLLLDTRTET